MKRPTEFNTEEKRLKAIEQGLYSAAACSSPLAVVSDGTLYFYIDVEASLHEKEIIYYNERRDFNPSVLEDLLTGGATAARDPGPLAEKVWQAIWHATKEEPRQCLMTFVEIFILKFLSDNLPNTVLPRNYSFYELTMYDLAAFESRYGKTQIEFYVQEIRPRIKTIFPEKTSVRDPRILNLFGLSTLISEPSVINGFAFLRSSGKDSLKSFNRTFVEILGYFQDFGTLSNIDPEFKLRLYETFLKKSVRQSKLGQFFTPRNVVRAMIRMAELNKLPPDSIVFDPAAGVGGFILEPLIESNALINNIEFANGTAKQRIRLLGADLDANTNILAKANTLIHLTEFVRDPNVTVQGLSQLMADMFLLLNFNEHLGTLEYPVKSGVDVILTNPPYVTQGSKIYKDEIAIVHDSRNGLDLRAYYDRAGLGLEALFLRYISGALKAGQKPAGRAYVIVPQGLLTRTEPTTKEKILSECNLLASISIPRKTFFNTPQKTYILVLEKRHTTADTRPDVFCGIVSSIGETLDKRRVPTPADNTLEEVVSAFLAHTNSHSIPDVYKERVKIVPASSFSASDRWDVNRFWDDDELVSLGARDPAIDRSSFMEIADEQIAEVAEDFAQVKAELATLEAGPTKLVSLADETLFRIRRGKRVTRSIGDSNPGLIPVYSGSKDAKRPICSVSEEWAVQHAIPIEENPIVTINANGFVGACFVRRERCIIHDDVMIVEVINKHIDLDYLAQVLPSAIFSGNFEYEAKLYNRVKTLEVAIPSIDGANFDFERQKSTADALKRFDAVRLKITELGKWAADTRIGD